MEKMENVRLFKGFLIESQVEDSEEKSVIMGIIETIEEVVMDGDDYIVETNDGNSYKICKRFYEENDQPYMLIYNLPDEQNPLTVEDTTLQDFLLNELENKIE
jgi:hypothetical protein